MKLLTILAIAAIAFNIAQAQAESCADGAGTVITGATDNHNYCASNGTMNWWSAYTWCEAQGRHLVSMYEVCPERDGEEGYNKCKNAKTFPVGSVHFYTTTPQGTHYAFVLNGDHVGRPGRGDPFKALCY